MKDVLNVFFATSTEYLQHFTVAATSLLENNRELDVHIFVIHEPMASSALDIPKEYFQNRYGIKVTFINIGDVDFSRFRTNDYFGRYTYYRLFVADFIPATVNEGLFLDVDIIVTASLKELTQIDTTGKYIWAVPEASVNVNIERLRRIGARVSSYFNAGVLYINLKAWRDNNLSQEFIKIADRFGKTLKWVDQDILNIHFANKWQVLDKKYNAIHLLKALPETPAIVHYNTFSKPWHYVDTHPYNYLYQQYLQLTPYKGRPGTGFSVKNFVLKNGRLFKRELRKIGLIK